MSLGNRPLRRDTLDFSRLPTNNTQQGGNHMIIIDDRSPLDDDLKDATTTIFILLGSSTSKAGEVHTTMKKMNWQPYQKYYLVTKATRLSDNELNDWFSGNTSDWYTVLGGKVPKTSAQSGPISDLLKSDGTPDIIIIIDAMLKGDQQS
jgi:hypothetical protein